MHTKNSCKRSGWEESTRDERGGIFSKRLNFQGEGNELQRDKLRGGMRVRADKGKGPHIVTTTG
jgi:hypothetical protein